MKHDKLMYRPREVGKLVGVTDETVKGWILKGQLPGCKVGGLWMVPAAALEDWVRAKTEAASKGAGR